MLTEQYLRTDTFNLAVVGRATSVDQDSPTTQGEAKGNLPEMSSLYIVLQVSEYALQEPVGEARIRPAQ